MSDLIYLALGTNLGNRAANLRAALSLLSPSVMVRRVSPIYETEPWGYHDQPAFLNQVLEAETELTADDLLAYLKKIEDRLGRQPTFRNGPRLIDIDILFYSDQVIRSGELAIPHPRLHERGFVLVPLADLAPGWVHPELKRSVSDLLHAIDTSGIHKIVPGLLPFGLRTYIMGILNITPDSFSGDGILKSAGSVELALAQASRFIEAGADILDVGGESTRPGALTVDEQQELDRVIPVIDALNREFDLAISVDTYKSKVAEAALRAGADWINDIWGLKADPEIGAVAARYGSPVILMHNRMKPANPELQERLGGRYVGVHYQDLIGEIQNELRASIALAHAAGVLDEQIILDPGIGFGKTVEQNLELLNRMDEIVSLGYPILLGPSRKSFIGYTLDLPPDQRVEGTAAAVAIGIDRGADIVRVHDVGEMVRVVRMTDAITRRSRWTRNFAYLTQDRQA